ncbi:MAG TPA: P-loop NTPase fold protein [Candidatus Deferrimicrobium sp.]|nr:P-loop NTPase fold protein [Candidatus Deferrimicrobium sp.]
MTKGFIKNQDLIQEDCKVEDLLDFSKLIATFSRKLDSISRPSIMGLVGRLGIGKSTMLYQMQKGRRTSEQWISFDAWKYPERKDLWEGFVLDFADQIGERKKAQDKLDGKDNKSKYVGATAGIISGLTGGLINLEFIKDFIESSPAKRAFEIQEILSGLIKQQEKDIYIVIEDIDRSGDAGIYFLETLRQFLKQLNLQRKFIAVVTIGDDYYEQQFEKYLKCLDYVEVFTPHDIGLSRFVETVFDQELFQGEYKYPDGRVAWTGKHKSGQLSSFLEFLLGYPSVTIRLLKFILRKAELAFVSQCADGHDPDWRVTICFEVSKYIRPGTSSKESLFETFIRTKTVPKNTICATFLSAMLGNMPSIYRMDSREIPKPIIMPKFDFKFVTRQQKGDVSGMPSWPWYVRDQFENTESFFLCDFYLDY